MFQEAGITIPTSDDMLSAIVARMREAAVTGDAIEAETVTSAVANVFTSKTATDTDLFNLIAFAKGCHEMASVYRAQGRAGAAELFHALGQDMLTRAGAVFAELMALGITVAGMVRH